MTIEERPGSYSLRFGAAPRSAGLHLSTVLRDLALRLGTLKPQDEEEDLELLLLKYPDWQQGDNMVFNRVAAGLAWEEWYSRQIPDLMYHFGELDKDGIAGTPDGAVWYPSGELVLHEFKFTWKSSNHPILDQWLYWSQLKSYCYMAGTTMAVLHVYYVNGNYKGSGPQLMQYGANFEQKEVEATWRVVTTHRDRMAA